MGPVLSGPKHILHGAAWQQFHLMRVVQMDGEGLVLLGNVCLAAHTPLGHGSIRSPVKASLKADNTAADTCWVLALDELPSAFERWLVSFSGAGTLFG